MLSKERTDSRPPAPQKNHDQAPNVQGAKVTATAQVTGTQKKGSGGAILGDTGSQGWVCRCRCPRRSAQGLTQQVRSKPWAQEVMTATSCGQRVQQLRLLERGVGGSAPQASAGDPWLGQNRGACVLGALQG